MQAKIQHLDINTKTTESNGIPESVSKIITKTYGDKYNCLPQNYKYLYNVFVNECNKYGILYKMDDIIKAYKKEIINNEQISLF